MSELPKIFCLTLKDTPKRREYAEQHFKKHNLDVEFFEGFDGRVSGLRTTIPFTEHNKEIFIKQGRIGCILSHYMLWKTIWHNSYDEVLILEDDAQLVDNFTERFTEIKQRLPVDWQYVFVGHCCLPPMEHNTIISNGIVSPIHPPMCTHAYMIKKSSIPVLLETNSQIQAAVDIQIQLKSLKQLKYYVLNPPLVNQISLLKQQNSELFDMNDKTFESLTLDSNFQ